MKYFTKYEWKDVRFEVKSISDTGAFEGLASTYGVYGRPETKDLGGDIVVKGAFTKSIQERGSEVPILLHHDPEQAVGLGEVEDTPKGLVLRGQLEMDLPEAKSAYVRLKSKILKGLSIGYKSIPEKTEIKNGVRYLKEVMLYEVSLVLFPMNEQAQVTAVKSALAALEEKMDFRTALDAAQTWAMRHHMLGALCESLDSITWDSAMTAEEKVRAADESIEQFHDEYVGFLPKLLALMDSQYKEQIAAFEQKEGRRISRATREEAEAALAEFTKRIMALLDGEAAGTGTSDDSKAAATQHSPEPELLHSLLTTLDKRLEIVL